MSEEVVAYEEQGIIDIPIDYSVYVMTKKERLGYLFLAGIFVFVIGYIFYQNSILALLLTPTALFYPKIKAKELLQRRKDELKFQFKDMLYSLSSSMTAGKALEPAFRDALKDLRIIYPNEEAYIIKECESIVRKLDFNESINDILDDFALRTDLEDIQSFVDVLQSCKKAGGNIVEVVRTTTGIINDKIEVKTEIDTMIASKKFEQKLMGFAPVAMILVFSMAASDYMEPIFSTLQGRLAMTLALIIMAIVHFVSQKVIRIDV